MLDAEQIKPHLERLTREANIWLATVRPDGRPHLIPIWFAWHDGKVWISTLESQKVRNIRREPRVTVSLEDGVSPVILEGTAAIENDPATRDALAPLFAAKYDWDFRSDPDGDYLLIAITPTRLLNW